MANEENHPNPSLEGSKEFWNKPSVLPSQAIEPKQRESAEQLVEHIRLGLVNELRLLGKSLDSFVGVNSEIIERLEGQVKRYDNLENQTRESHRKQLEHSRDMEKEQRLRRMEIKKADIEKDADWSVAQAQLSGKKFEQELKRLDMVNRIGNPEDKGKILVPKRKEDGTLDLDKDGRAQPHYEAVRDVQDIVRRARGKKEEELEGILTPKERGIRSSVLEEMKKETVARGTAESQRTEGLMRLVTGAITGIMHGNPQGAFDLLKYRIPGMGRAATKLETVGEGIAARGAASSIPGSTLMGRGLGGLLAGGGKFLMSPAGWAAGAYFAGKMVAGKVGEARTMGQLTGEGVGEGIAARRDAYLSRGVIGAVNPFDAVSNKQALEMMTLVRSAGIRGREANDMVKGAIHTFGDLGTDYKEIIDQMVFAQRNHLFPSMKGFTAQLENLDTVAKNTGTSVQTLQTAIFNLQKDLTAKGGGQAGAQAGPLFTGAEAALKRMPLMKDSTLGPQFVASIYEKAALLKYGATQSQAYDPQFMRQHFAELMRQPALALLEFKKNTPETADMSMEDYGRWLADPLKGRNVATTYGIPETAGAEDITQFLIAGQKTGAGGIQHEIHKSGGAGRVTAARASADTQYDKDKEAMRALDWGAGDTDPRVKAGLVKQATRHQRIEIQKLKELGEAQGWSKEQINALLAPMRRELHSKDAGRHSEESRYRKAREEAEKKFRIMLTLTPEAAALVKVANVGHDNHVKGKGSVIGTKPNPAPGSQSTGSAWPTIFDSP